jgi:hypothetical protein
VGQLLNLVISSWYAWQVNATTNEPHSLHWLYVCNDSQLACTPCGLSVVVLYATCFVLGGGIHQG